MLRGCVNSNEYSETVTQALEQLFGKTFSIMFHCCIKLPRKVFEVKNNINFFTK